jgi:hypothetical protein
VSVPDAIVALRTFPRRWRAALAVLDEEDEKVLRRHPQPDVWSALGYAAHTRDALAVNGWALDRTLTEDHPVFEWPDAEVRNTTAAGYDDLDVTAVLDELGTNATRIADRADRTDAADWRRPASIPHEHGEVDALWFLHHAVHEGSHHLRDVQRVLEAVRRRR